MHYTLADVMEAERRIRAECPDAEIHQSNFGWTLAVKRGLIAITVFDAGEGRPTIYPHGGHDLDWVIRTINDAPRRRSLN